MTVKFHQESFLPETVKASVIAIPSPCPTLDWARSTLIAWGVSLAPYAPARLRQIAAAVAGDVAWLIDRERRSTLLSNLAFIAPGRDPAQRKRLARATFRNFAQRIGNLMRLPSMTPTELRAVASIKGLEVLDRALAEGHGVILVSPHLGQWEFCAATLAAHGYRINVVVEKVAAGTFDVLKRLERCGVVRVIPLGAASRDCVKVLQRGEVLGLVADRLITGKGLAVDFAGGRRWLPCGPAALALKHGAPVVGAYLLQRGPGHAYEGHIEAVAVGAGSTVEGITGEIGAWMSGVVSLHPDQWFVFQPGWLEPSTLGASR
jgi:KDO2-lipid IV(A) lauroyltransferase